MIQYKQCKLALQSDKDANDELIVHIPEQYGKYDAKI